MSIYFHDIDIDPRNPANRVSLDIVSCACRTCNYPVTIDSEFKDCPSCGDLIIYHENDGRVFSFDGSKYEEVNNDR